MPQPCKLQHMSYNKLIKSFYKEGVSAMKNFLVGLCAVLAMSFAYASETAVEPQQSCQTESQAKANATSQQLAQQVLCCCNTYNGSCCKYVTFCGGFVPGCMCSGRSIESEPLNSDATEGKVRI